VDGLTVGIGCGGDLVDGNDIGVLKARGDLGLPMEACDEGLGGIYRANDLEGDSSPERRVFGFIDDPHSAAGDFTGDEVFPEASEGSGHFRGSLGLVVACLDESFSAVGAIGVAGGRAGGRIIGTGAADTDDDPLCQEVHQFGEAVCSEEVESDEDLSEV
jgi:hypothetical protein